MPQPKRKKSKGDGSRYVPQDRYRWIDVREEGADKGDPFLKVYVRADLTGEEIDELVWKAETPLADIRRMFAPLVTDWNLHDPKTGEPVPAPADGNPEVFKKINPTHFWAIVTNIKLHSSGDVDAKPSTPSLRLVEGDGDTSTSVNDSSVMAV